MKILKEDSKEGGMGKKKTSSQKLLMSEPGLIADT